MLLIIGAADAVKANERTKARKKNGFMRSCAMTKRTMLCFSVFPVNFDVFSLCSSQQSLKNVAPRFSSWEDQHSFLLRAVRASDLCVPACLPAQLHVHCVLYCTRTNTPTSTVHVLLRTAALPPTGAAARLCSAAHQSCSSHERSAQAQLTAGQRVGQRAVDRHTPHPTVVRGGRSAGGT